MFWIISPPQIPQELPVELEGGSLLEDGVKQVKQETDFQPSFCQTVCAWRSLLLCCLLFLLFSVGVYSVSVSKMGMFEVSSTVSRPLTSVTSVSHTTSSTSSTSSPLSTASTASTAISHPATLPPSRPAISHSAPPASAHMAMGRRDPSSIPNATLNTTPWVVHRFATAGVSPHMCLQCLMVGGRFSMPVLELQVEYARRHGYDLYTYTDQPEPDKSHEIHFWKFRSTQYLIESGTTGCDYIFWMDSDAVIMNMSFSLENLIHWDGMEDTDIVLAADTLAANLAQSLWKFSRFTHQILEDSWNMGSFAPLFETEAFNAILGGCQPENSPQQKRACYEHMDVGWTNHTFAEEYFYPGNNRKIKELMVNKSLLPHVKWVPKSAINAYPFGFFLGSIPLWRSRLYSALSRWGKKEAWYSLVGCNPFRCNPLVCPRPIPHIL